MARRFIERYPGTIEPSRPDATTGFPAWARWQHFLNLFFLVFIIRAGLQILSDHPRLYWTRHSTPGAGRPSVDSQAGLHQPPGADWSSGPLRHSIGLARWWHLGVDALWLLNGVVFVVLLFATDRWQRLVPTSWDVLPNALSVLIQYLSLNWPVENGWVAYNAPRHLPLAAVSVLETHANTPCLGGMLPRRLR